MRSLFFLAGALFPALLLGQEPAPESQPSSSQPAAYPISICGDGVVQPGEACDDGNTSAQDLCRSDCGAAIEAPIPGLKSPDKARNLALGMTAASIVPLVGIPLFFVGPSAGHFYAKEPGKALRHSALRVVSAAMISGLGLAAIECGLGPCETLRAFPELAIGSVGVIAFSGLTAYDIIDAPRAALRYNANLYDPSRREEVLPMEAAPWPEKVARRAKAGLPNLGPKRLYIAAATLGSFGLLAGGKAMQETLSLRSDLRQIQQDGTISLAESQRLGSFDLQKRHAHNLGAGADTLFALAIPIGAAGFFLQKRQAQILREATPPNNDQDEAAKSLSLLSQPKEDQ